MKIKTPFFEIQIETLFFIVLLVYFFSNKVHIFLNHFFMCYLFIIFHELTHIFIASLFGYDIDIFKLTLSGVCIKLSEKKYGLTKKNSLEKIKILLIYIAGPLSNLILALIFFNNKPIFEINIAFFIINLFPVYPLDGYNILFNFFDLLFKNVLNNKGNLIKRKLLIIINYFTFFIIFIIGIIQLIINKNPIILIFSIYICVLNYIKKTSEKNMIF